MFHDLNSKRDVSQETRDENKKIDKIDLGKRGENIAELFLKNNGHKILDRNYRKKWGELDIVSTKNRVVHFVEVKTTASKEGFGNINYRPEENVRLWKKQRMKRIIQTYLLDKKIDEDREFEIDIVSISIDPHTNESKVTYIKNVILD